MSEVQTSKIIDKVGEIYAEWAETSALEKASDLRVDVHENSLSMNFDGGITQPPKSHIICQTKPKPESLEISSILDYYNEEEGLIHIMESYMYPFLVSSSITHFPNSSNCLLFHRSGIIGSRYLVNNYSEFRYYAWRKEGKESKGEASFKIHLGFDTEGNFGQGLSKRIDEITENELQTLVNLVRSLKGEAKFKDYNTEEIIRILLMKSEIDEKLTQAYNGYLRECGYKGIMMSYK